MAKKTKKVEVEEPQIQEEVAVETAPVVEQPKTKRKEPTYKKAEDGWEIKNRTYFINGKAQRSLSRSIKSSGIYYFDEEKGYQREIKYCENQRTCFVDEMQGDQRLSHIVFRRGTLHVPREEQTLQKLLSLYHPDRKRLYREYQPQVQAQSEVEIIELEIAALTAA